MDSFYAAHSIVYPAPTWKHCAKEPVISDSSSSGVDKGFGVFLIDPKMVAGAQITREKPLFSFELRYQIDDEHNANSAKHPYYMSHSEMVAAIEEWELLAEDHTDYTKVMERVNSLCHHKEDEMHYRSYLESQRLVNRSDIGSTAKFLSVLQANANGSGMGGRVLFESYSRFNHSCSPDVQLLHDPANQEASTFYIDKASKVTGAAPHHEQIKRQLFTSYLGEGQLFLSAKERQGALRAWHFECTCQSCRNHKTSDPNRNKLKKWFNKFANMRSAGGPNGSHLPTLAEAEALTRQIADAAKSAIEEELYAILPCIYRTGVFLDFHLAAKARDLFDFDLEARFVESAEANEKKANSALASHLGNRAPKEMDLFSPLAFESKEKYLHDHRWTRNPLVTWRSLSQNLNSSKFATLQSLHDYLQIVMEVASSKLLSDAQLPGVLYSGALACFLASRAATTTQDKMKHIEAAHPLFSRAKQISAQHPGAAEATFFYKKVHSDEYSNEMLYIH